MPDETPTPKAKTERETAIEAYHNAATPTAKAEVVKKYPILSKIFSTGNHS